MSALLIKDITTLIKMSKSKTVYRDRLLRITKHPRERGNIYYIEMTCGRICRSWEEYFSNDEEAISSAKKEFESLYK